MLQVVGLFAVLGLAGVGTAGLLVFKDRVRVIVQDDSVPAEDPTAALRDDLHTLGGDVQALSQALGDNLERVLAVVEERAAVRHDQLAGAVAALADSQRQAAAEQSRLAELGDRLAAIELLLREAPRGPAGVGMAAEASRDPSSPVAQGAATPRAAVQPPAVTSPVVETEAALAGEGRATQPGEAGPAPVEPQPVQPQPGQIRPSGAVDAVPHGPAPASRSGDQPQSTGFLNFKLPSRTFQFAAEQRFEVIASLSRVGFDAKSTLHDFSGVTSDVTGELVANLGDPSGAWRGHVACRADQLLTGVEGRDEAMREHLDTAQHAEIRFAIERLEPAPDGIDAAAETVRGTVHGRMTIRGVTRELSMPVEVSVDASKRLVVAGQAAIQLPDYSVPVPSKLGVINMEPEVKVWVALRLRVRGGATR